MKQSARRTKKNKDQGENFGWGLISIIWIIVTFFVAVVVGDIVREAVYNTLNNNFAADMERLGFLIMCVISYIIYLFVAPNPTKK